MESIYSFSISIRNYTNYFACYIYQASKSKKQIDEKIDKEYVEYEKKQKELEIKENQEKSIKWNEKIL